jgi:subtilisin family serine protease
MEVAQPHELVIKFAGAPTSIEQFAREHHLEYIGPVPFLQDQQYHRFLDISARARAPTGTVGAPVGAHLKHERLHQRFDPAVVEWYEAQVPRVQHKRVPPHPTDPLYALQWHLSHIEAKEAWDAGFTGKGVVVCIVDDGVQYTHADIARNYVAHLSHNFNEGNNDPAPHYGDFHGTACAGVMGAAANNTHCGCGVAPDVSIAAARLIGGPTTDILEAMALSYGSASGVHIYSSSWGPQDDGRRMVSPGRITLEALANNAQNGRSGKGSIYVWASGNGGHIGDSCAYDGYASSPYTIAVGAMDSSEHQSFYSEGCAALICVAPSSGASSLGRTAGITTVDVSIPASQGYEAGQECTSRFGGTSSACPTAAGAIALALQANPQLGWRDVQLLIAKTSRVIDASDPGWSTNGRGFRHNQRYGFGVIQARTLATLAHTWTNVGVQSGYSSGHQQVQLHIMESAPTCVAHAFKSGGGGGGGEAAINFIEHVLIRIGLRHPSRGQLRIRLKSPENVVSILADVHGDNHANYPGRDGWLFTSVRHFGERRVNGDWYLCVEDAVKDGNNGIFDFFELAVFGHAEA